jgi:hypothetical protein
MSAAIDVSGFVADFFSAFPTMVKAGFGNMPNFLFGYSPTFRRMTG